jgi:hypothetical protein
VPIRTIADAEVFSFAYVANPDVVIWDLHESRPADRGEIFATLRDKLCAHLLRTKRKRAALVIDEAATVGAATGGQ